MSQPAGQPAAWSVLLPPGTVWLPAGGGQRRAGAARRLRRALADPGGQRSLAAAAPPWALLRSPAPQASPDGLRAYAAIPSRHRPVIIASPDPGILRYVADSVLSVPPGTGPAVSMTVTAGLRLLRLRPVWALAAALRAGSVVLVGRRR